MEFNTKEILNNIDVNTRRPNSVDFLNPLLLDEGSYC